MEKIFLRLREIAFEMPDGVIIGIGQLLPINKGWVVRIEGMTDFEGRKGMLEAVNLASATTGTIAGAIDGNVELWDVVMIFDSEEQATKAGNDNGQMTIYQIETATLKWLK